MNLIVSILRAAHCRSTHHFFAIDALARVGTDSGRRLANLLLKHYGQYLRGAKDPDDRFKDFQNHVLHVSEGGWGGAVRMCDEWLARCYDHLDHQEWSDAAYACGVLSHYFTDPIMPLHTGQSAAEGLVHRPMEWSICKGYDEIYSLCQFNRADVRLSIGCEKDWLARAVTQAATVAHQHYQRLIEIYNLARGTVDPPRGLTKEARQILSQLFDVALGGWASVLTKIAAPYKADLPDVSLSLATAIAGVDMPRAWIARKIHDATERAAVLRIFDEYTETGKLVDYLPQEVKVVRREFAAYTKSQEPSHTAAARTSVPHAQDASMSLTDGLSEPDDRLVEQTAPVSVRSRMDIEHAPDARLDGDEAMQSSLGADLVSDHNSSSAPAHDNAENFSAEQSHPVGLDSPLVAAPSIGPKTAARFSDLGIETIEQFLSAEVESLARGLNTSWIDVDLLTQWQDQARLACDLAPLAGYKAQLIVAVGCRTSSELAQAEPAELRAHVQHLAETAQGQRILRRASVPDLHEVERWIAIAQAAANM